MVEKDLGKRQETYPLIIGVAGGSGSGKSTVARHMVENLGSENVTYVEHDSYYKDQSHNPMELRAQVNYDHPDSLDNDLLFEHLQMLASGQAVELPLYDFKTYVRLPETRLAAPRQVILVEGILIFTDVRIRNMMNLKIFVDTDADIRFIRRLRRDVAVRGRTMESVIDQYLNTVRLMHLEFVEPTKRFADLIIPEGGYEVPELLQKVYRLAQLMGQV